jgi:hypothetical protein
MWTSRKCLHFVERMWTVVSLLFLLCFSSVLFLLVSCGPGLICSYLITNISFYVNFMSLKSYSTSIYHHSWYNTTNCSEQTVQLYWGLTVFSESDKAPLGSLTSPLQNHSMKQVSSWWMLMFYVIKLPWHLPCSRIKKMNTLHYIYITNAIELYDFG